MPKVELMGYKICRLALLNEPEVAGEVGISDSMDFSVDFKNEDNLAVAVLTEHLEMEESNKFYIELELKGFFHVEGIANKKLQKEANVRCYEALFPYMDQFLRILSIGIGMSECLSLEKRAMEPKDVHIGKKPQNMKDKKVIDFHPEK